MQRVHVISPSTIKPLAREYTLFATGYRPDRRKNIYIESTIHINLDMKKNKPMQNFTI